MTQLGMKLIKMSCRSQLSKLKSGCSVLHSISRSAAARLVGYHYEHKDNQPSGTEGSCQHRRYFAHFLLKAILFILEDVIYL